MNYIAHYYCHQEDSILFRIACLLPDVFPNFSYTRNHYFRDYDITQLTDREQELWRGIEMHYRDDSIFHHSEHFHHYTQRIKEEIQKSHLLNKMNRQYILAHILYELIIDNMLLDINPLLPQDIFRDTENISDREMSDFLHKIIPDRTKSSIYLDSYNNFIGKRFLNFYKEEANLIKALRRVTSKYVTWAADDEAYTLEWLLIIKTIKSEIDVNKVMTEIIRSE